MVGEKGLDMIRTADMYLYRKKRGPSGPLSVSVLASI